jgi:cell division protein FtsI (penicillin-binding protein 3)
MHRANSSFGYGMMVTHAQMLKAYSAFNNDGLAVTPRLVNYLQDAQGKRYTLPPKIGDTQAIGKKAANQMHDILKEVVKRGTGVAAQYPGLEIGGKTGTAHIAKKGRYVREYHSSFYGFANDNEGHKYTIGVMVIRAKKRFKYFASQSAVPTFRRIVDILVELDYLKPEGGVEVVSPEIKIEPKVPPKHIEESEVPQTKKKKKVTPKPVKKPSSTVKELFKIEKKPAPQPKPVHAAPVKDKSPNELFEDLF